MAWQFVYLFAFFGSWVAAAIIISEMLPDPERLRIRAKMGVGPLQDKSTPGIFRVIRPGLVLVAPIVAGLDFAGSRKRVEKRLKAGGYYGVVPVDDFLGAKFVFAGIFFGVGILYLPILGWGPIYLGSLGDSSFPTSGFGTRSAPVARRSPRTCPSSWI